MVNSVLAPRNQPARKYALQLQQKNHTRQFVPVKARQVFLDAKIVLPEDCILLTSKRIEANSELKG